MDTSSFPTREATVDPTAMLIGDVQLGAGVEILPYTVIYGPAVIGDDSRIGPHTVIGTAAQHRDHLGDRTQGRVRIGARTTIREHVSVHRPCTAPETVVGDDVIVMAGSVINHDSVVEDGVVITANVALAGTVHVMRGANVGQSASVHQRTVIGPYAMIALGAPVVRDVPPFGKVIPGKPLLVNSHAVKRAGFVDHADEVAAMVTDGTAPTEPQLRAIYDEYLARVAEFGR